MAVCKFYLQGNCRFGDKCRNEHPQNSQQQSGGSIFGRFAGGPGQQLQPPSQPRGRSPQGPFQPRVQQQGGFQQQGAFQQQSGSFSRPGGFPQQSGAFARGGFQQQSSPFARQEPEQRGRSDRNYERWKPDPGREHLRFYRPTHDEFHLETKHIIEDLNDRPEWPLSAFAAHPAAPKDLIDASREFSPEEVRVQYYIAKASGQEQLYAQEEARLANEVAQQTQEILNNVSAAVGYIIKARNEHPNRWDVINDCNKSGLVPDYLLSKGDSNSPPNAPAQRAPLTSFGEQSGLGQTNAFNQPAPQGFGGQLQSLSQPTGFGQQQQPSGFGQQSQQAGIFGNSAPSGAFGAMQHPQNESFPLI